MKSSSLNSHRSGNDQNSNANIYDEIKNANQRNSETENHQFPNFEFESSQSEIDNENT